MTEPSLCTPVFAHKGTVRLEFHINGVAAHSSKPHLGKNALVASAQLTQALWAEHQRLQSRGGPLGPPTLTPTIAAGGHGPNIVPQHASVACDYRVTTLPENDTMSEDTDEVVARLAGFLKRARARRLRDGGPPSKGVVVRFDLEPTTASYESLPLLHKHATTQPIFPPHAADACSRAHKTAAHTRNNTHAHAHSHTPQLQRRVPLFIPGV